MPNSQPGNPRQPPRLGVSARRAGCHAVETEVLEADESRLIETPEVRIFSISTLSSASAAPYLAQNLILAATPYGWEFLRQAMTCLLYTSPSPRDGLLSRMPSSA